MRIGLSYDLSEAVPLAPDHPEDALEEFDSLETVEIIAAALKSEGHSVVRLGGGREFLNNTLREKVELVFNIAEGRGNYRSREAQVPAVLEILDIPYSGSDPQCLAICLDKPLAKKIVAASGIRTPRWQVITNSQELKETSWDNFPFPAFIKPAHEGSSKGVRLDSRVESPEQIIPLASRLLDGYRQSVMVEEFINGDEVTVGLVGNSPPQVFGPMRILPKRKQAYFVYSLEVKRDWKILVDYEYPAQLEPEVLQEIKESSLRIFDVLRCRDFARLDFRVSAEGIPYFLEINPLPGLSTHSDLPIVAIKMGWSHEALILAVLHAALERYPQCAQG